MRWRARVVTLSVRGAASVAAIACGALAALPAFLLQGEAAASAIGQAVPGGSSVTIVNFDYGPATLTVDTGTTVTWTNTSNRPHTVTDRGGTFDSQPILPTHVASVTFTAPGTYNYFCRINPSRMNGTVVVRAGPTPSRVVRVQAVDPANIAGEQFRFDPNGLSVPAGTTLLVANVGGKPHTLSADDGSFTTGIIPPGAEQGRFAGTNAVIPLNSPGTYAFHCDIHPTLMRGVITVVGTPAARPPPPASNAAQQGTILAADFFFNPTQLTVAPGAALTVDNKGRVPHTVTFDDVKLDTGVIQPGSTSSLVAPSKPGSYSYRCDVHPAKMRGVLVVLGQNATDPGTKNGLVAKPAVALPGRGPGGRISALVLVTGVLAAFLGGLGMAPFLLRRKPADGGEATLRN